MDLRHSRLSKGKAKIDWGGRGTGKSSRPADGIAQFHPPGHTSAEARQRSGRVWTEGRIG